MNEKRKIVVLIDKSARYVEKEIADEAYTWEEYPDAKLRAADMGVKFIEHIQAHLKPGQEVICKICGKSAKAIAEYEGET